MTRLLYTRSVTMIGTDRGAWKDSVVGSDHVPLMPRAVVHLQINIADMTRNPIKPLPPSQCSRHCNLPIQQDLRVRGCQYDFSIPLIVVSDSGWAVVFSNKLGTYFL